MFIQFNIKIIKITEKAMLCQFFDIYDTIKEYWIPKSLVNPLDIILLDREKKVFQIKVPEWFVKKKFVFYNNNEILSKDGIKDNCFKKLDKKKELNFEKDGQKKINRIYKQDIIKNKIYSLEGDSIINVFIIGFTEKRVLIEYKNQKIWIDRNKIISPAIKVIKKKLKRNIDIKLSKKYIFENKIFGKKEVVKRMKEISTDFIPLNANYLNCSDELNSEEKDSFESQRIINHKNIEIKKMSWLTGDIKDSFFINKKNKVEEESESEMDKEEKRLSELKKELDDYQLNWSIIGFDNFCQLPFPKGKGLSSDAQRKS